MTNTTEEVVTREHESRVGTVVEEFPVGERRRFVITVSEKEFQVARYCGLLIQHPVADRMIYWGPWKDIEDVDAITACTITKNTEADLRSGPPGTYTHDEHGDIQFRIEGGAGADDE